MIEALKNINVTRQEQPSKTVPSANALNPSLDWREGSVPVVVTFHWRLNHLRCRTC